MPAMTGRTLRSAVVWGLFVGLCLCEPLTACSPSPEALRLAADQGDTEAQVNLGFMYAVGRGVSQDRVAAHMWLSLAVAQASDADRDTFVETRDAVAEKMSAEQIAEAQRLARQ